MGQHHWQMNFQYLVYYSGGNNTSKHQTDILYVSDNMAMSFWWLSETEFIVFIM